MNDFAARLAGHIPTSNLDDLDTHELHKVLVETASALPTDDVSRTEALALIYQIRAIINRVKEVNDRHPAPVLTLHRRNCLRGQPTEP